MVLLTNSGSQSSRGMCFFWRFFVSQDVFYWKMDGGKNESFTSHILFGGVSSGRGLLCKNGKTCFQFHWTCTNAINSPFFGNFILVILPVTFLGWRICDPDYDFKLKKLPASRG